MPIAGGIPIEEEYLVPRTVVLTPYKCAAHSSAINQTLKHKGDSLGYNYLKTRDGLTEEVYSVQF